MKRGDIYKCEKCGNIIQVMHPGAEMLACCGSPMQHIVEAAIDAAKEKHVPVIEKTATGFKVSVGSVAHPMEEKHYIEWIELIADGKSYIEYLKPGDVAVAEFCVNATKVSAREYCNLHGLWIAQS